MIRSRKVKETRINVMVTEETQFFRVAAWSDWTDDNAIRLFLTAEASFHISILLLATRKRNGKREVSNK